MANLTAAQTSAMRRILLSTAKILISAALLYLALRKVDISDLFSRLGFTSAVWIALAIAATLSQVFASALRWREISADCGASLSVAQAVRYCMIGSFFNQTLPSSIGGDAMRLWLVGRGPAGWRAAAYSIFVDRAIGLIALGLLIAASLPWSLRLINDPQGRLALMFVDLVALAAAGGFLLLGRLHWRWLGRIRAVHHLRTCSVITNRAIFDRERWPKITFLSLLIHFLAVVIAWCVVKAIAAPVLFGEIFLLVPPVMLITMLPISIAGWGVREASMALTFGYAGLATGEGVNVSLLYGGVFLVVGALGGLVWIFSAERSQKGSVPVEST
ncbi:hypothetical protein ACMYR2_1381 [Nitrobacter sp. TKz-YC01]